MIPLARPVIGEEELAAVERVLRSGRLVLGPEAERFESELAERCGVSEAVAVSSGTAALHLALWALGVGPGDEVIVPALSFPAPAAAALAVGATPVAADVDAETWNVAPEAVRAALGPKTAAVVVVDQFGFPADHAAIEDAVGDVPIVEDAACSLGASFEGRQCGSFGAVATFSFHPRKVITTGEGGAVLTRDAELADRVRALRDHGRLRGRFVTTGLNLRLPEMAAALGRCQLRRLDAMVAERSALAARYLERLEAGSTGLRAQRLLPEARTSWQTFALALPSGGTAERDALVAGLVREGIEAGLASFSLGKIEAFASAVVDPPGGLPVSDSLHERGIALPLHSEMSVDDVDRVTTTLAALLREDDPKDE